MPPRSRRPAYWAVADTMRLRIEAGRYDDEPIPTPDALAAELGTSRRVAQDALALLRRQGRIEGSGGAGSRVRRPPAPEVREVNADDPEVRAIVARLRNRDGITVTRVELRLRSRPPTVEEMERFDIGDAQPVTVQRWVFYSGEELVYETVAEVNAERVEYVLPIELPDL